MLTLQLDTKAFSYPDIPLPAVWTICQTMEAPVLADIESAVRKAIESLWQDPRLQPGAAVAIGVGSRGINNLLSIVRAAVEELKQRGANPFIVPAMGSHGGATAEGQVEVLAGYGITPEKVGVPIRATMEVAQVSTLEGGYPVYFDCHALSADAVVVINRIKPHTDFIGEIESGIAKMCAIGLGKQKGASRIHNYGADGLREIMPRIARKLVETVNIVGGIAIIENPFGQTAEIHAVPAADIAGPREKELLRRARTLCPRLPFQTLDVLVIDQMGKDISGTGIDTHVIGRARMPSIPESMWDGPDVRMICVLDLTDHTHGNAAGLGLADITTRRLIERIDFTATFMNYRTSGEGCAYRARIPIVLEDAEEAVKAAIALCGRGCHEEVRLARIRNTEFVETIEVSEPLLEEVGVNPHLQIIAGAHPLDLSRPLFSAG